MNTLPSSQFKTQYPHLTEPVIVTVNGHPIGYWYPATGIAPTPPSRPSPVDPSTAPDPVRTARAAQKQRDEWLRKNNS